MNSSTTIVTVIAILVIAAGAWWFIGQPNVAVAPLNNGTATTTQGTSTGTATSTGNATSTAPMTATIRYNGTIFSPQSVTIARGGTVTWINDSSSRMWVATARHPDHLVYDGTSTDTHCADNTQVPRPLTSASRGLRTASSSTRQAHLTSTTTPMLLLSARS